MISAQSAVLWPGESQLTLETLELEEPRPGEVLVKIIASGICHTDIVLRDGSLTRRPIVLGHEGSGMVEKLGPGVTDFQLGDRVVASFASCGACPACSREAPAYCQQFFPLNFQGSRADGSTSLSKDGQQIHSHVFGQSSFSTHALCPTRNLVRVDDTVPLELAGPFGCAFQTGAGAVLNSFKVPTGASVMILGAGAVGLSALMAARGIAGASTVIAVDIKTSRLGKARSVGATHVINGAAEDFALQLKSICEHGVDFIIDTTGQLALVERCVDLLAVQGTLGLAATYPLGANFSFEAGRLMTSGKRIQGVMEGDTDLQGFIPKLLDYYKQGRFPVDQIVDYFDFSDINAAIEATECGDTIKAIVRMP